MPLKCSTHGKDDGVVGMPSMVLRKSSLVRCISKIGSVALQRTKLHQFRASTQGIPNAPKLLHA